MLHALVSFVLFVAIFGLANPAHTLMFQGLELTDWQTVNVPNGVSLTISTSEDVYIYAPNDLVGDNLDIRGGVGSLISVLPGTGFDIQNTLSFCTSPIPCGSSPPYDLTTDLVINILDPFVDLTVLHGGDMVIGVMPIPEPSSGLLVLAGLLALGTYRRGRRGVRLLAQADLREELRATPNAGSDASVGLRLGESVTDCARRPVERRRSVRTAGDRRADAFVDLRMFERQLRFGEARRQQPAVERMDRETTSGRRGEERDASIARPKLAERDSRMVGDRVLAEEYTFGRWGLRIGVFLRTFAITRTLLPSRSGDRSLIERLAAATGRGALALA